MHITEQTFRGRAFSQFKPADYARLLKLTGVEVTRGTHGELLLKNLGEITSNSSPWYNTDGGYVELYVRGGSEYADQNSILSSYKSMITIATMVFLYNILGTRNTEDMGTLLQRSITFSDAVDARTRMRILKKVCAKVPALKWKDMDIAPLAWSTVIGHYSHEIYKYLRKDNAFWEHTILFSIYTTIVTLLVMIALGCMIVAIDMAEAKGLALQKEAAIKEHFMQVRYTEWLRAHSYSTRTWIPTSTESK